MLVTTIVTGVEALARVDGLLASRPTLSISFLALAAGGAMTLIVVAMIFFVVKKRPGLVFVPSILAALAVLTLVMLARPQHTSVVTIGGVPGHENAYAIGAFDGAFAETQEHCDCPECVRRGRVRSLGRSSAVDSRDAIEFHLNRPIGIDFALGEVPLSAPRPGARSRFVTSVPAAEQVDFAMRLERWKGHRSESRGHGRTVVAIGAIGSFLYLVFLILDSATRGHFNRPLLLFTSAVFVGICALMFGM